MIEINYDFTNGPLLIHAGTMNLLHELIRNNIDKFQLKSSFVSIDEILDSIELLNLTYQLKGDLEEWNIKIFLSKGFIYIIKEKGYINFLRVVEG